MAAVETPCVEWQGSKDNKGYGRRYDRRTDKPALVHRLEWEKANGPIPPGLFVMHLCDNPACYRVDHLRLGTAADNNADMHAKGRDYWRHRTHCKNGHAYTDDNIVIEYANGKPFRRCITCRNEYRRRTRARSAA